MPLKDDKQRFFMEQTSWMFSSGHAVTSSLGTRTRTKTNLRVCILTIS